MQCIVVTLTRNLHGGLLWGKEQFSVNSRYWIHSVIFRHFYKKDIFVSSSLRSFAPRPFCRGFNSRRKECAPMGSHFQKDSKNNFDKVVSPDSVSVYLKIEITIGMRISLFFLAQAELLVYISTVLTNLSLLPLSLGSSMTNRKCVWSILLLLLLLLS